MEQGQGLVKEQEKTGLEVHDIRLFEWWFDQTKTAAAENFCRRGTLTGSCPVFKPIVWELSCCCGCEWVHWEAKADGLGLSAMAEGSKGEHARVETINSYKILVYYSRGQGSVNRRKVPVHRESGLKNTSRR